MWFFQRNDLAHGPISVLALNQSDRQSLLFKGDKEGWGQRVDSFPLFPHQAKNKKGFPRTKKIKQKTQQKQRSRGATEPGTCEEFVIHHPAPIYQPGTILPSRGHLPVSAVIVSYHNWHLVGGDEGCC